MKLKDSLTHSSRQRKIARTRRTLFFTLLLHWNKPIYNSPSLIRDCQNERGVSMECRVGVDEEVGID